MFTFYRCGYFIPISIFMNRCVYSYIYEGMLDFGVCLIHMNMDVCVILTYVGVCPISIHISF